MGGLEGSFIDQKRADFCFNISSILKAFKGLSNTLQVFVV